MKKVIIQYRDLRLSGSIFVAGSKKKMPAILLIHGWRSAQSKSVALASSLVEKGFVCLTFDLPGHEESQGDSSKLAIKSYLGSCLAAYDFLAAMPEVDASSITVIGSSFGGYLAAILTSERPVNNLVLRVPANYPDSEFSEAKAVRSSESPGVMEWRSQKLDYVATRSLASIHAFQGDIFIVESGNDQVVPHQTVQNYIDAVADKTRLSYLIMENAPHSITEQPDLIAQYNDAVVQWLELRV